MSQKNESISLVIKYVGSGMEDIQDNRGYMAPLLK